jgi:hypothetical protein
MERKRTILFRDADFNVVQAIISKTASKTAACGNSTING